VSSNRRPLSQGVKRSFATVGPAWWSDRVVYSGFRAVTGLDDNRCEGVFAMSALQAGLPACPLLVVAETLLSAALQCARPSLLGRTEGTHTRADLQL
jgi:hypothetical protein